MKIKPMILFTQPNEILDYFLTKYNRSTKIIHKSNNDR